MTTERTTKPRGGRRSPAAIRENLPAPDSAEGRLFHYSFDEAAQWTPYTSRGLLEMSYRREIEYVNNGRDSYMTGKQICALVAKHTVPTHEKPSTPAA